MVIMMVTVRVMVIISEDKDSISDNKMRKKKTINGTRGKKENEEKE